jgi:Tfp pilus assembly protein PilX
VKINLTIRILKMDKIIVTTRNEKGSVLIVALVILVLLTLMGISVTTTSDIDIQIAKNEQEYIREFYVADSAWRQAIQWLDTRAQAPSLVNKTLFTDDDTGEHALNVRNYSDGGNGVLNDDFQNNPDGTLGSGSNQIDYWYKIAYLNEAAMEGTIAPLFGEGFRKYSFIITSVAAGRQTVELTVTRVYQSGE